MKLPINYNSATQYQRRVAREEYVKVQEGKCYWCKNPLSGDPSEQVVVKELNLGLFPPNFLKHPVHWSLDWSIVETREEDWIENRHVACGEFGGWSYKTNKQVTVMEAAQEFWDHSIKAALITYMT